MRHTTIEIGHLLSDTKNLKTKTDNMKPHDTCQQNSGTTNR
jgi:hypothetical protein